MMIRQALIISTIFLVGLLGRGHAFQEHEVTDEQYVKLEAVGKLESGVMAIGGEHTGWKLTAKGIEFEVEFESEELEEKAKGLNGKIVKIRGPLNRAHTPERGERWVITANELQ
jgi:hypothetical protein